MKKRRGISFYLKGKLPNNGYIVLNIIINNIIKLLIYENVSRSKDFFPPIFLIFSIVILLRKKNEQRWIKENNDRPWISIRQIFFQKQENI